MMSFDGPDREVCTARRIRTNTPLQALVTLNDSAFLEAARHFADRLQKQNPGSADKQIRAGFEKAIGHDIDENSFEALEKLYRKALLKYQQQPEKGKEMGGGNKTAASQPERSALIVVTNAILNLDEYVTKN
jgi:hypothetical protein